MGKGSELSTDSGVLPSMTQCYTEPGGITGRGRRGEEEEGGDGRRRGGEMEGEEGGRGEGVRQ